MGLSESRPFSQPKKTPPSPGNMHLFFFDVYKSTVNIISPSSGGELRSRHDRPNSNEVIISKNKNNNNNNNNNNNDTGDDEDGLTAAVSCDRGGSGPVVAFDANKNPSSFDAAAKVSLLNRSEGDDDSWDSNHNAVVDENAAVAAAAVESPSSPSSMDESDDIDEESGGEDRATLCHDGRRNFLTEYKSFPTRPFRRTRTDITSTDWTPYNHQSYPMPSWHRHQPNSKNKNKNNNNNSNNSSNNSSNNDDDEDEDRSRIWCSCSNPYCNYTCHTRCRALVSLDCNNQETEEGEEPSIKGGSPLLEEIHCEESDQSLFASSPVAQQDLHHKIEAYNATTALGNEMTLSEDGHSVSGFIRVHMNLCRPINVVSGAKPMSLFEDDTAEKTLTSFYLPRDTIKSLHITSETTTQEVISALLKKYKVVDNPHKFALYERYYENGESMKVRMRRIQEGEHPLLLALMCGDAKTANQQFVLQENDTGDISWEAFSLPELNNFLRILKREEEEYLNQVQLKYKLLKEKLREAMDYVESTGGETWYPEGDELSLRDPLQYPESEQAYHPCNDTSSSTLKQQTEVSLPMAMQRYPSMPGMSSFTMASSTLSTEEKDSLIRQQMSEASKSMSSEMYRRISSTQLLDVS